MRGNREVHGVALAELVAPAKDSIVNENGAQKQLVKGVRVIGSEPQRAPKHDGLVTPDRMCRVEAVVRQLAQVNEGVFSVGKQHAGIVARMASRPASDGTETPRWLRPSRWDSELGAFEGEGIWLND